MFPAALSFALLFLSAGVTLAEPPQRVVSMNLCTDQLALLLAAPEQLVSVSQLSHDPHYSSLSELAQKLRPNTGQAEEIAFLRPDVVLAGRYTTRVTVDMLQRLGYRVEVFDPENSLEDIKRNLNRMGQILGREERAEVLIRQMEDELAKHLKALPAQRPATLLYYSSGFTSGSGTLADDILAHAGLRNLAPDLGLSSGGVLPLEAVVLAGPDVVIRGQTYAATSQGQEMLAHPILEHLLTTPRRSFETSPEWTCGTNHTIAMVIELAQSVQSQ